ncbi:MAG TPA: hypothetical protein VFY27_13375 [Woeseiaceae bacterium]|nr:hypothetical protein [Woeseiaceae bacterium]
MSEERYLRYLRTEKNETGPGTAVLPDNLRNLRNLWFAVVRNGAALRLIRASLATAVALFERRQKKETADFADFADCMNHHRDLRYAVRKEKSGLVSAGALG